MEKKLHYEKKIFMHVYGKKVFELIVNMRDFLFRPEDEKTFHNQEKTVQKQHILIQDGHRMLKI
jgi:hypothetical protein